MFTVLIALHNGLKYLILLSVFIDFIHSYKDCCGWTSDSSRVFKVNKYFKDALNVIH